jgi:hypothetical protein
MKKNPAVNATKKSPSVSETGHAKNVATFQDLISFCEGYGTKYNPSKEALKVANLKATETQAKEILQQVKTSKTSFDNATNSRVLAFENLKPLSTRVINALSSSGATALTIADANTIHRKIQGSKSASAKAASRLATATQNNQADAASPTATSKTISSSQLSYDSQIDHVKKLIEVLTQEPAYNPNEEDLKTNTLQAKLVTLDTTNLNLINSYTNWSNARIERNNILYDSTTGLIKIAAEVKKYVLSVFDATSPQYRQVSGLKFTKSKAK